MAAEALTAWANLVAALVLTMRDAEVENGVIHAFLDHLGDACESTLEPMARAFARDAIRLYRSMVPSND